MVPELLSKSDMVYPHEVAKQITNEPHFRRVWQHYREHIFKQRLAYLVDDGVIT